MIIRENDISYLYENLFNFFEYAHKNPEIGFFCFETSKFIQKELNRNGITDFILVGNSIIGKIKGEKEGETIGLRADIDGLNIIEDTSILYKSTNGYMHACGHDAHFSILLFTLIYINAHLKDLSGEIIFIFQEAEEGPHPGGGYKIVNSYWMKEIDEIYALHVTNNLNIGVIGMNESEAMASSDTFRINIIGRGGHVAKLDKLIDPIYYGISFYNKVVKLEEKYKNEIIKIASFNGGNTTNVIPNNITIEGTVRTYNELNRKSICNDINDILISLKKKYNIEYNLVYDFGYPALVNDIEIVKNTFKTLKNANLEVVILKDRQMTSEDFAYYLEKYKGCFMWLGNKVDNDDIDLHNSKFMVNKKTLIYGILVFLNIIFN